jgi:hypothetical protein
MRKPITSADKFYIQAGDFGFPSLCSVGELLSSGRVRCARNLGVPVARGSSGTEEPPRRSPLHLNLFPMRADHPSEWTPNTRRRACATMPRNTTIIFYAARNSKLYLRFFAIIYILYFYLIGAGIVPNLAIIAIVPLSAHSLRRRFTILRTTTLSLSN